jgi:tRNA threonylcarbamoyladenosine biosynthesis protein TsaE
VTLAHPPILETRLLRWASEADCAAFAQGLAAHAGITRALVELHGTLGAGKTTFVRHLLRALGVQGRIKSPTYAVVEPYELPNAPQGPHGLKGTMAAHFDFYRFDDPREALDAGLRDTLAEAGLRLVEWPEKAAGLLPVPDLRLTITIAQDDNDSDTRETRVDACTPLGVELLG